MSSNLPDPNEFMERAQRMLRELFGGQPDDAEPWEAATRDARSRPGGREPSAQRQRENLTFALATRAVEALEDLALDVAAIRQRLERADGERRGEETGRPDGDAGTAG